MDSRAFPELASVLTFHSDSRQGLDSRSLPWCPTMSLAVTQSLFQAGGHGGRGRAREDQRRLPGPGAGQSLWPHGCPVLEEKVGDPRGGRAEETAAASAESAIGVEPLAASGDSTRGPGREGLVQRACHACACVVCSRTHVFCT